MDTSTNTKVLIVKPSFWKMFTYFAAGSVFVAAGIGMLLLPASQIHPTALNPEPPVLVRIYGIVAAILGLAVIYLLIRLAGRIVLSISPTEISYPREHYTVYVEDIKEVHCYKYYMLHGLPARMVAIRLKDPEKYSCVAPKISKWGAQMLGADLYWNLAVASDKSFEKVCRTLEEIGIPVTYAAYKKHSLKELRRKWGTIIGSQIWLSERVPFEADVAVFTLLVAGFILVSWRYILR